MQVPNSVLAFLAGTLEAMSQKLPENRIAELAAPISVELNRIYESCPPLGSYSPGSEPKRL